MDKAIELSGMTVEEQAANEYYNKTYGNDKKLIAEQLLAEGLTCREAATEVGLHYETVKAVRRKMEGRYLHRAETFSILKQLLDPNKTQSEIAQQHDITTVSVSIIARQARDAGFDIPQRYKGRPRTNG